MWNVIGLIDVLIFIDSIEPLLLMSKTKFANPDVDWFNWIVSSIFCNAFSCPMSSVDRVAALESINRPLNFVSSYLDDVKEMYAYGMLEFFMPEFLVLGEFSDSSISMIWCFAAWSVRKLMIRMQSEVFNVSNEMQNISSFSWTLSVAEISETDSRFGSTCNFSKYWITLSSSSLLPSRLMNYWVSFLV